MHEFQNESLKLLALRIMRGLRAVVKPEMLKERLEESMLEPGLFIPGELGPVRFQEQINLLVCKANGAEAQSVAEELQNEALRRETPKARRKAKTLGERTSDERSLGEGSSSAELPEHLRWTLADENTLESDSGQTKCALLLYMNDSLFDDGGIDDTGSLAAFVNRVLELHVRLPDALCFAALAHPLFPCGRLRRVCGEIWSWCCCTSRIRSRARARSVAF